VTTTDIVERLSASLAGRYDVIRELGRGGFATVFLATDVRHGRQVAIKVLHPELQGTMQSERFLREIRHVAVLTHPHILPLLDSGEADGLLFFVMPYVEGESLRSYVAREKQLSLTEAVRLVREVADGLSYAHARGLIHRDIKPENILLSSGHAIITDFGIGRAIDESATERLTYTGMATGSPAYMSPEQWMPNERVDGRTDQYSLACVLYELLVGEPPFSAPTPNALMARHTMSPVPSVRHVRPSVSEAVDDVIGKAMAKIPADRFQTISQFADALELAATMSGSLQSARAVPHRRRFTRVHALIVAGVVVSATVGFLARDRLRTTTSSALRLVVLPFENLGAASDAFLADGVAGELTNQLSTLSNLGVIARTSAVQYRNSRLTAREIGRELNVQYLVEGSVRRTRPTPGRDSIHVNARLVRASDDIQVWSDKYSVEANDLTAVQSRIAEQVASELDVALREPERRRLSNPATRDALAYEYYLRANEHYERSWTRPDVEAAISLYEKAVETDPEYALAYAKLGKAHTWMYRLRYDLSEDRLVAAKRATDHALALDDELAAAHVALGLYYYWGRNNYERAIEAFEIARELEPNNTEVYRQIANVRRRQGRFDDAIANYRKAAELDPRSHQAWFNLGETLLFVRNYDEAKPYLDRVTDLAPEFLEGYVQQARLAVNSRGDLDAAQRILRLAEERIPATAWRGSMLEFARIMYHPNLEMLVSRIRPGAYGLDSATYHHVKGTMYLQTDQRRLAIVQFDSARAHLERMREQRPDQAWIHGILGVAYAVLGRNDDAIRAAERAEMLLPVSKDALDGPEWIINLGRVHATLGNEEKAVEYYRRALSMPSWISRRSLERDPLLETLLKNSAFQEVLSQAQ
jgi:serine/threonine-protein kinase